MMKTTIFKTAVILFSAFMMISCSKDGATGPQGDTGPAGSNGTNGTNGTDGNDGNDGTDGNANVFGSNTFALTTSNWTAEAGGAFWTSSIVGASAITQSIVDRGIVSVFRRYTQNGQTVWSPLPDTNTNINLSYEYGVGTINLFVQSTNAVAISNPGAMTLRYVAISPSKRMANPNTNWKDYKQVKSTLHLQD
jgi:hypothetical protein